MSYLVVRLLSALLCLSLLPSMGWAGAWPRGKGNNFSASALRLHGDGSGTFSSSYTYYHEYGLTDRLTVGVDVGGAISGFDKTIVFLSRSSQWQLNSDFGLNYGTDLGIGMVAGDKVIRPGFSIGRGLTSPPGWISLETAVEYFTELGAIDWKADLTYGYAPGGRARYYAQLQSGKHHGDQPFARLAANVAYRIGWGISLDAGVSTALYNSEPLRLKLGIWHEF